jgi:Secretion system C-terminal sorting domain
VKRLVCFILLTCVLFNPSKIYNQWSTDPNNNLVVGYGLLPEICSDSSGGCYITYEQNTVYPKQLILERLNRYGNKPWGSGKRIFGEFEEQCNAKMVEDRQCGVIVAYLDAQETGTPENIKRITRLCVQRVDSNGNFLWGATGIRVSLSETNQGDHNIVTDGKGGCIIVWVDTLGNLNINRIESTGNRVWGDSGKYVWNSPERPPMVYDGDGGCYLIYGIGRLQRFKENGDMYWPSTGILIPIGVIQMAVDSSKNIYLFGTNFIGIDNGIYIWTKNIQKVSTSGDIMWDSLGIVIDTEKTNLPSPNYSMIVKPDGFVHLAWGNNSGDTTINIIQNIFPNGDLQYTEKRSVGLSNGEKIGIEVKQSDNKSVIYSWMDSRDGYWNLWAQKLDSSGNIQWDSIDVPITLNGFSDYKIIGDGNNGIIAMWFVQASFAIYAQQLSPNGILGEIITSVNDNIGHNQTNSFVLFDCYPNPFNNSTSLTYYLPKIMRISICVYDLTGAKVKTLFSGNQTEGNHKINFNAETLSSGLYILNMIVERTMSATKKILLIK